MWTDYFIYFLGLVEVSWSYRSSVEPEKVSMLLKRVNIVLVV